MTLGYSDEMPDVFNALHFGLPQKRERALIVAMRDSGAMARFRWPSGDPEKMRPLSETLEPEPVDASHYASEFIRKKRAAAHSPAGAPMIWHENKGGNVSSHPYSCALRASASHNYLLVNGIRRLTPREMLRLQGFPDSGQAGLSAERGTPASRRETPRRRRCFPPSCAQCWPRGTQRSPRSRFRRGRLERGRTGGRNDGCFHPAEALGDYGAGALVGKSLNRIGVCENSAN